MKKITFIFICILFNDIYALDKCGNYRLNGIFKKSSVSIKDSLYIVNEGTRSEERFKIKNPLDLTKLSMTNLKPTTIHVMILLKTDNISGEINQVLSIDPGILNSMNVGTNNVMLLKEETCISINPIKR